MNGDERAAGFRTETTDSWVLSSTNRRPWLRAYLGNGRLAVQVVAEGGLGGSAGMPLHQMAELYDRAPSREVEHPVALPDWTSLRLSLGGEWLDLMTAVAYGQDLDLRSGMSHTRHAWLIGGLRLDAEVSIAVLRQEPNLAVVRCRLCADRSTTVEVTKSLAAAGLPGLRDGQAGTDAASIWVEAQTQEYRVPVAAAGTFVPPDDGFDCACHTCLEAAAPVPEAWSAQWFTDRSPLRPVDGAPSADAPHAVQGTVRATLPLRPGEPRTLTWLVAVHSGRSAADPLSAARADLQRAQAIGPDALIEGHRSAWAAIWRADLEIDGDDELQRCIRAGTFALLCSIRGDVPASVAPMGLSSMGYNGHIFWDADTWMFPPLLLLHPDAARSIPTYRQDRLQAARDRARAAGYDGAMYPWESATVGTETTPASIARTGLKEHHITACVAIAQWQYYLATGDRTWLAERAWPVLEGAARFWVSRAEAGPAGTYVIRDVIAADEYAEDVDNDAFTNGAARAALLAADSAAAMLGHVAPPEWRRVAEGLVLARDGDLILEFDGYDGRMIKQGDVELLTYPLEYPLSATTIAVNLDTYRAATDPLGPAMGKSISAVVSAQLGRREEALDLLQASYRPHLWGPFYSLAETPDNGAVNFLTGVGGALQSLLFGFAGLRMHRDALAVDPLLPAAWRSLHIPAIRWRGESMALAVLPGDRCEIGFHLAGRECRLALQRWRPGAGPLTVALVTDGPCTATLHAEGWTVTAHGGDGRWHLSPPPGGPASAFVQLSLHLRSDSGQSGRFVIEQRVRTGDE